MTTSTSKVAGEAIARLMHDLRPEWDLPGCVAAVRAVARRHPADVGMAAIRLAMTPQAKTPMALGNLDGLHWVERLAPVQVLRPPVRAEECKTHAGEHRDACRGCAADRLAGEHAKPTRPTVDAADYHAALAAARAELDEARARLCDHGVTPQLCKHPEHQETSA